MCIVCVPYAIKHSVYGCITCKRDKTHFTFIEHHDGKPVFIPNIYCDCKEGCLYKSQDENRISCANFKKFADSYINESPEGFDESLKVYKELRKCQ